MDTCFLQLCIGSIQLRTHLHCSTFMPRTIFSMMSSVLDTIAEKLALDNYVLEYKISGCTTWHRATDYRKADVLRCITSVGPDRDCCHFAVGHAGTSVQFMFARSQPPTDVCPLGTLVFKPCHAIDRATGQPRRNAVVRPVQSGEMVLNLSAEYSQGRVLASATSLSGEPQWTGYFSTDGSITVSDCTDAATMFLRRASKLTKYQSVKLVSGMSVLKKRMVIYAPSRNGPIKFRLHGKTSKIQALITDLFKRVR